MVMRAWIQKEDGLKMFVEGMKKRADAFIYIADLLSFLRHPPQKSME